MAVSKELNLCYSGSLGALLWLSMLKRVGYFLMPSGFEVVLPAVCAHACGHASCELCGLAKTTA